MNRAWRLVALLSLTATASYLCRVNVSVAGVQMMKEFGLDEKAMGRVFSAFLAGYALCQIPGGMLADRFGARRVLAWSALAWVASIAWMSLPAMGIVSLLLARLVLGVAEAPTFPSSAQAISRWIGEGARGRANGSVIAAIGLGSAIAPPLVTYVMTLQGWRTALLVSAVPALVAGVAWLLVTAPAHERREAAARTPMPRSRGFVLLTLSYTLQGYVGYIFVFWFYLYLVNVRHFDLLRGSLFGSLPWLLSILSIPLGGALYDRLGARRNLMPIAGLGGSGLLIAAGANTGNAWMAAVCLALATALVLSTEGPFWASMTRIAGDRAGTAGGVMNMGSNLGGFVSPALTPVLAGWMGWERALMVSAAVAVVAALLWLGVGNQRPAEQPLTA